MPNIPPMPGDAYRGPSRHTPNYDETSYKNFLEKQKEVNKEHAYKSQSSHDRYVGSADQYLIHPNAFILDPSYTVKAGLEEVAKSGAFAAALAQEIKPLTNARKRLEDKMGVQAAKSSPEMKELKDKYNDICTKLAIRLYRESLLLITGSVGKEVWIYDKSGTHQRADARQTAKLRSLLDEMRSMGLSTKSFTRTSPYLEALITAHNPFDRLFGLSGSYWESAVERFSGSREAKNSSIVQFPRGDTNNPNLIGKPWIDREMEGSSLKRKRNLLKSFSWFALRDYDRLARSQRAFNQNMKDFTTKAREEMRAINDELVRMGTPKTKRITDKVLEAHAKKVYKESDGKQSFDVDRAKELLGKLREAADRSRTFQQKYAEGESALRNYERAVKKLENLNDILEKLPKYAPDEQRSHVAKMVDKHAERSDFVMTWGKYKGFKLEDIPISYIEWLADGIREAKKPLQTFSVHDWSESPRAYDPKNNVDNVLFELVEPQPGPWSYKQNDEAATAVSRLYLESATGRARTGDVDIRRSPTEVRPEVSKTSSFQSEKEYTSQVAKSVLTQVENIDKRIHSLGMLADNLTARIRELRKEIERREQIAGTLKVPGEAALSWEVLVRYESRLYGAERELAQLGKEKLRLEMTGIGTSLAKLREQRKEALGVSDPAPRDAGFAWFYQKALDSGMTPEAATREASSAVNAKFDDTPANKPTKKFEEGYPMPQPKSFWGDVGSAEEVETSKNRKARYASEYKDIEDRYHKRLFGFYNRYKGEMSRDAMLLLFAQPSAQSKTDYRMDGMIMQRWSADFYDARQRLVEWIDNVNRNKIEAAGPAPRFDVSKLLSPKDLEDARARFNTARANADITWKPSERYSSLEDYKSESREDRDRTKGAIDRLEDLYDRVLRAKNREELRDIQAEVYWMYHNEATEADMDTETLLGTARETVRVRRRPPMTQEARVGFTGHSSDPKKYITYVAVHGNELVENLHREIAVRFNALRDDVEVLTDERFYEDSHVADNLKRGETEHSRRGRQVVYDPEADERTERQNLWMESVDELVKLERPDIEGLLDTRLFYDKKGNFQEKEFQEALEARVEERRLSYIRMGIAMGDVTPLMGHLEGMLGEKPEWQRSYVQTTGPIQTDAELQADADARHAEWLSEMGLVDIPKGTPVEESSEMDDPLNYSGEGRSFSAKRNPGKMD